MADTFVTVAEQMNNNNVCKWGTQLLAIAGAVSTVATAFGIAYSPCMYDV
ncbi:hypothetical protein [Bifidobacterium gallicum]|uniref:Uncharacterized protein n=1 Tax=Bifidobacterium gallicum DSM 20093 = LMG 11596 TaxID=561180 RepID=D1NSL3_9BIFI|nr:hypothetical protein [Bifidobacterium gallicum]EFA23665.1 hypothetical protein BIFGAL_02771 [Bifidobacterium gallicum DSM 20093 = LMG 11596]KFI58723.1 hypothetical protein BGLCM_1017 [Bifidobacterium gallicum DSM 20093 = LMG 11596]